MDEWRAPGLAVAVIANGQVIFGADIVVSLDGGRLRAAYGGAYAGGLEHWHYDTFRARWDAAWRGTALLTFVLDGAGEPERLEAMGASFRRQRGNTR